MGKDELFLLKSVAWLVAVGLSWLYSPYSSTPRFNLWFWGFSFYVEVFMLTVGLTLYMTRR